MIQLEFDFFFTRQIHCINPVKPATANLDQYRLSEKEAVSQSLNLDKTQTFL